MARSRADPDRKSELGDEIGVVNPDVVGLGISTEGGDKEPQSEYCFCLWSPLGGERRASCTERSFIVS